MKTILNLHDELLTAAKCHTRKTGRPRRAVVEDRFRRLLAKPPSRYPHRLADPSVGDATATDVLKPVSWQDLRGLICPETAPGDCAQAPPLLQL